LSFVLLVACGSTVETVDGGGDDAGMSCVLHTDCDDGVACNGSERCEPSDEPAAGRTCRPAEPIVCAGDLVCREPSGSCGRDCAIDDDADGDGHRGLDCGGDDCVDVDPDIHPGAEESCSGPVDERRDEDCDIETFGSRDADGDGAIDVACCNDGFDFAERCGRDCDDSDPTVGPESPETCNERDDDCDRRVDEGLSCG
jgi:hypothetical protein